MSWYWLDENNQVCGPVNFDDPRIHAGWGGQNDPVRRVNLARQPHGVRPCGWERVAFTELAEGCEVSTVFLGLDHRFSDEGPPLVFESMAFWGIEWMKPPPFDASHDPTLQALNAAYLVLYERRKDQPIKRDWDSDRYSTWEEAEEGHRRMVVKLAEAIAVERENVMRLMRGWMEESPERDEDSEDSSGTA